MEWSVEGKAATPRAMESVEVRNSKCGADPLALVVRGAWGKVAAASSVDATSMLGRSDGKGECNWGGVLAAGAQLVVRCAENGDGGSEMTPPRSVPGADDCAPVDADDGPKDAGAAAASDDVAP